MRTWISLVLKQMVLNYQPILLHDNWGLLRKNFMVSKGHDTYPRTLKPNLPRKPSVFLSRPPRTTVHISKMILHFLPSFTAHPLRLLAKLQGYLQLPWSPQLCLIQNTIIFSVSPLTSATITCGLPCRMSIYSQLPRILFFLLWIFFLSFFLFYSTYWLSCKAFQALKSDCCK